MALRTCRTLPVRPVGSCGGRSRCCIVRQAAPAEGKPGASKVDGGDEEVRYMRMHVWQLPAWPSSRVQCLDRARPTRSSTAGCAAPRPAPPASPACLFFAASGVCWTAA
jgi:hypothetical protein